MDVPRLEEEHLMASSLILADVLERVPRNSLGLGPFVIGTTKVRPRIDNTFHRNEKMYIYLQVYNFEADEKSRKPDGTIRYEISKKGSNDKILILAKMRTKRREALPRWSWNKRCLCKTWSRDSTP